MDALHGFSSYKINVNVLHVSCTGVAVDGTRVASTSIVGILPLPILPQLPAWQPKLQATGVEQQRCTLMLDDTEAI